MFNAVIFDFDGVILDSEPLHYEACCHVLKPLGIHFTYTDYQQQYIGLSDKEMFPLILKNNNLSLPTQDILNLRQQKITKYTQIINEHTALPLVPGVDEYIANVAAQGKKIAICSGSTKSEIEAVLTKVNDGALKSHFNIIVTADDIQQGKPSPEGYLLTANRLNVAPEECFVIEDTPHGIKAAKSAGMYVVAVLTTHTKDQLQLANEITESYAALKNKP